MVLEAFILEKNSKVWSQIAQKQKVTKATQNLFTSLAERDFKYNFRILEADLRLLNPWYLPLSYMNTGWGSPVSRRFYISVGSVSRQNQFSRLTFIFAGEANKV